MHYNSTADKARKSNFETFVELGNVFKIKYKIILRVRVAPLTPCSLAALLFEQLN